MSGTVATETAADGLREYAGPAPQDMTDMLARTVERVGGKTAFVDEQTTIDYATFAAEVEALAGRIAARGVGSGDRVALLFPNGILYTTAVWAIWRLGAIAVPLNARLLPAEMSPLVRNAEASLILAGEPFAEAADTVAGDTGVPLAFAGADAGLLADVEPASLAPPAHDPAAPAAIMYTSGTTGVPKGVIITHRNLVQNARTCVDVHGRRDEDVELICVPQFNITGLGSETVPVVLAGMTAVLARFETALVLELIERHGVTTTVMAPTMWWRLLEDPGFEPRRTATLRLALFGGAPMPTALLSRMREAFSGASFGNGYGMTETCSMVTYIGGDAILDHVDSVGRPLPITDMRIVDPETGRDVAPGEPGELWFRGPQISLGYWRNEEATAKLFQDGWLKTGDAGSAGDDGYVVLRDRLKDVIKRSGESIYCFEVEDALHQHPAVLEAAVVGIPDEVYGERVAAVVATKPGAEAAGDELTAFCRDRLARFKVPERVAFVDALPRNAGGKVLKAELRTLVTTESDPRQGKEKVS